MKISASAALIAVLSILAALAVQAGGAPTGVNWHSGGNAAPVCDGTGRAQNPVHDGRLFGKQCPLLASGDMPDGDPRHSSAALSQGAVEFRVASIKAGTGDF
jgi:hypothetical protein